VRLLKGDAESSVEDGVIDDSPSDRDAKSLKAPFELGLYEKAPRLEDPSSDLGAKVLKAPFDEPGFEENISLLGDPSGEAGANVLKDLGLYSRLSDPSGNLLLPGMSAI